MDLLLHGNAPIQINGLTASYGKLFFSEIQISAFLFKALGNLVNAIFFRLSLYATSQLAPLIKKTSAKAVKDARACSSLI